MAQQTVMVDTSAIFALLDRDDINHPAAISSLKKLKEQGAGVLITNYILAESHALITNRLGDETGRLWLRSNIWSVEKATESDEDKAVEIILSHTDKSYTYTDAITFAVMLRMDIKLAFAYDRHFSQFGFSLIT